MCQDWSRRDVGLIGISGREVPCRGEGFVRLGHGGNEVKVKAVVVDRCPLNFGFILGMNGIELLGGVTIESTKKITVGEKTRPRHLAGVSTCIGEEPVAVVEEKDFKAVFDGHRWVVTWLWSEGKEPLLRNTIAEYEVPHHAREAYEQELAQWIEDGWLVLHDEQKHGPPRGLIPLMAVCQKNKEKVRPVLDYRELNTHVDVFTGKADVCRDKMQAWRRMGSNTAIVDLRKAYLQVHVDKSLWAYQTVMFKGKRYCLTRLGFGLNVAPLIMSGILTAVFDRAPEIKRHTSAYLDDIYVDESGVACDHVVEHLREWGLVCKSPERVSAGARVLGIRVQGDSKREGRLYWCRDNKLEGAPDVLTRRVIFSICGQLTGHLPVCGWLRVAASYLKRVANAHSVGWDDEIREKSVRVMLEEIYNRLGEDDPAHGRWDVEGDEADLWVDASSIAIGVVLQVGGMTIEDGSWMRESDSTHINMAELEAVIRGLNVALSWNMKRIRLKTDSSTVYRWLTDALTGKARLKTKAASEMLIRRRLEVITQLREEYKVELSLELVPSKCNLADALTRVPNRWLSRQCSDVCAVATYPDSDKVRIIHQKMGHPGVERTTYFVRRAHPHVTRRQVQEIVRTCEECSSIDPAPQRWAHGSLSVPDVWGRLGMDITHYNGKHYLTLIDCGPSRFTLWCELRREDCETVMQLLARVFCERGPPREILTDNATIFRSQRFRDFVDKWGCGLRFRCAYVPEGNSIVERVHRSIKKIAARTRCDIKEAVYLYNITPLDDINETTAPINAVHKYFARIKGIDEVEKQEAGGDCPYRVGEEVWVKGPQNKCFKQFAHGKVTGLISPQAVEVNGMPRHVKDLRHRTVSKKKPETSESMSLDMHEDEWSLLEGFSESDGDWSSDYQTGDELDADDEPEGQAVALRRSGRTRRPLTRLCC